MKKISLLILIFALIGCGSKYQRNHSKYTEKEIKERAKVYFGYDFDFKNSLNNYIVDGKNLNVNEFKLILDKFKEREYRKIDFEKKACDNSSIVSNCGLILTIETDLSNQNESQKREILERTMQVYRSGISDTIIRDQDICPECKLIFINNQPYKQRDALKILNEIDIDEIEYIVEFDKPMNPEYFGKIGQSGWVQIFTK